jgi:cysteinyl-tRNA synthetase
MKTMETELKVKLYNTMARHVEEFKPLEENKVKLYACGLTVYNYAHIGNLRTYVFEDVLRRILEYAGYEVEHVMNVTDVGHLTDDADSGEDKMLKSAREKEKTVWEIAEFYTKAFFEDVKNLNILMPTVICKATEHIDDMIELIRRIEENGYTYISGGNVYFDISKFENYGKLARLNLDDLKAGARIKVDDNKKNPFDFVLWFTKSKFKNQAMIWDSPWGKGYPGWHIECSAMSMKYLGEQFDIHCGGIDHVPVHHTNEIAQSESATGKKWVNYWLHGEYLLMGKEKMAKSSGKFLTLKELKKQGFNALDYRYYLLGAQYRTQLEFSFDALKAAKNAYSKLKDRIISIKEKAGGADVKSSKAEEYLNSFLANAYNDMNMPKCLSDLWGLVKDSDISESEKLPVLYEMDKILGLGFKETEKEEISLDKEIEDLIQERETARKNKDFKKADEIRDFLKSRGIILRDTPEGIVWDKIR